MGEETKQAFRDDLEIIVDLAQRILDACTEAAAALSDISDK